MGFDEVPALFSFRFASLLDLLLVTCLLFFVIVLSVTKYEDMSHDIMNLY